MKKRTVVKRRKTTETDITVKLNIDGTGKSKIMTGIGFLDHMLELFAFWGLFDLEIQAKGDLKVDKHHTNEDVGMVLGDAFEEGLNDKKGIRRIGSASVPMEDVVANVTLDISGRGFYKGLSFGPGAQPARINDEGYTFTDLEHFLDTLAKRIGMNLFIELKSKNTDVHTNIEPIFKALGIAMDQAAQIDPRRKGIPSTKGVID